MRSLRIQSKAMAVTSFVIKLLRTNYEKYFSLGQPKSSDEVAIFGLICEKIYFLIDTNPFTNPDWSLLYSNTFELHLQINYCFSDFIFLM